MRIYTKEAIEEMVKDWKKRRYDIPLYDERDGKKIRIGTVELM